MASQLKSEPVREPLPPMTYVGGCPVLFQEEPPVRPVEWWGKVPLLYEDDDDGDMGESNPHLLSNEILHVCVSNHLADQPQYQVFADMNLYYRPADLPEDRRDPYVSPDTMVVEPFESLDETVSSYTVGTDGPAPKVTFEVLSKRSAQQHDLKEKVIAYAIIGVEEYILVDVTGKFLPEKLLLKRLQADGTYRDERDADGGVTSKLGFRLIIESDGQLRVINGATGQPYVRPLEIQAAIKASHEVEERARRLEVEVACLREIVDKQRKSENDSE